MVVPGGGLKILFQKTKDKGTTELDAKRTARVSPKKNAKRCHFALTTGLAPRFDRKQRKQLQRADVRIMF